MFTADKNYEHACLLITYNRSLNLLVTAKYMNIFLCIIIILIHFH